MKKTAGLSGKLMKIWRGLGPGLITGASDDDPSGIATYSIAGAQQGYSGLWTALYTLPMMIAIQEICARIGLVTGHGLAGAIRKHYSKWLLAAVALLMVGANTFNVGADLSGMAEATNLLVPVPVWALSLFFAALIAVLMVRFPYHKIARVLKWLCFSLLAYVAAAFVTHQDWPRLVLSVLVPHVSWTKGFIMTLVAVLGTTISPYLFFWVASEEVEEHGAKELRSHRKLVVTKHELKHMRDDISFGMVFSNLIMFFIMATTASVFFGRGLDQFSSVAEVASALRPLAGDAAFLLFALGVVGTGLLAIPVLAGSSAYVLSEVFGWNEGLSRKFREARAFYGVIILSAAIGFVMTRIGFGSVYLLYFTAVAYGFVSVPVIGVILHISNNRAVMGENVNGWFANVFGAVTLVVTALAVIALFVF